MSGGVFVNVELRFTEGSSSGAGMATRESRNSGEDAERVSCDGEEECMWWKDVPHGSDGRGCHRANGADRLVAVQTKTQLFAAVQARTQPRVPVGPSIEHVELGRTFGATLSQHLAREIGRPRAGDLAEPAMRKTMPAITIVAAIRASRDESDAVADSPAGYGTSEAGLCRSQLGDAQRECERRAEEPSR